MIIVIQQLHDDSSTQTEDRDSNFIKGATQGICNIFFETSIDPSAESLEVHVMLKGEGYESHTKDFWRGEQ